MRLHTIALINGFFSPVKSVTRSLTLVTLLPQLRSSFNKAFSKKGGKPYADIEEIATPESSAPSSPKVHHDGDNPPAAMKASASASSAG